MISYPPPCIRCRPNESLLPSLLKFPAIAVLFTLLMTGCSGRTLFSRPEVGAAQKSFRKQAQIIISDNTIYQNNHAGIRVRGSAPISIKNCDIYQNGNGGINLNFSAKVAVRNSNIFENKSSGIGADNALMLLLRNNKIHQNDKGGVRIRSDEQSPQVAASASLKDNTIFLNRQGGVFTIGNSPFPTYLGLSGNTLYQNKGTGIRIEDNVHMTAFKNDIYKNEKAGIATYINDDLPPILDAYQNKIHFNRGAGIFIHGGITGQIGLSDNLIYSNYRAGVACGLWGEFGSDKIDVEILHNTIVGNGSDEEGPGVRNDSPGSVVIKNNIIAYNFTTGIMARGCGGNSYNLLFANGETSKSTEQSTSALAFLTEKIQYAGCGERQRGDVLAAPRFTNPDQYDFRLHPHSPAIDVAERINTPYFQSFPTNDLGVNSFLAPPAAAFIPQRQ